jgi:hypothetical protein
MKKQRLTEKCTGVSGSDEKEQDDMVLNTLILAGEQYVRWWSTSPSSC